MRSLLVFLISCYKMVISPFLGHHCRFYPTCSSYAQQAIAEHGVFRGVWLAARRLSKCHPWHEGGADPVPPCQHPH